MPPKNESEAEIAQLIRRVVLGKDQNAFERLMHLHQARVRAFLRRLTGGDKALADDLAQETFFKAYLHIANFRGTGRFVGWLFKIAYQEFAKLNRAKTRERVREYEPIHGKSSARDARLSVDQLLQCLPTEERAAIVLHYRYGMTHPEVADQMDIPLGTVKTLIRRAKSMMRDMYQGGLA